MRRSEREKPSCEKRKWLDKQKKVSFEFSSSSCHPHRCSAFAFSHIMRRRIFGLSVRRLAVVRTNNKDRKMCHQRRSLFCSALRHHARPKWRWKAMWRRTKKKSSMLALFISNLRLWHENISKMNKLSSVRGARSMWRLCKNLLLGIASERRK